MNSVEKVTSQFEINSSLYNYMVYFLDKIPNIDFFYDYDIVVVDSNLASLELLSSIKQKTIFIKTSESIKNLTTVKRLLTQFSDLEIKRSSKILCIGGGCIQDLVTLTSSIFMRGIDWDFIPTTVQAMGDSCLGGKSSINLNSRKNLIGNYYPPKKIFITPEFLQTLPDLEILSGLIEVMKINFAKNLAYSGDNVVNFFLRFNTKFGVTKDWQNEFNILIRESLLNKKYFIEKDEFDKAERKMLNFGHTFGHAFESHSSFKINHGMAVGLGMLCAFELARINGLVSNFDFEVQLYRILKDRKNWLTSLDENIDVKKFILILLEDKKADQHYVNFIIPEHSSLKIWSTSDLDNLEIVLSRIFQTVFYKLRS